MIEGVAGFLDGIIRMPRTNDFKQFGVTEGFTFKDQEPYSTVPLILRDKYIFKKRLGVLKRVLTNDNIEIPNTQLKIYDFINYNDDVTTTTIFQFKNEEFKFNPFIIYPRSVFTKMKNLFVSQEIVFDDLSEFNDKYAINSNSSEHLSFQLNKSSLVTLLDQNKIYLEGEGDFLIFYFKGKALDISTLNKTYNFVIEFVDRLLYDDTDDYV